MDPMNNPNLNPNPMSSMPPPAEPPPRSSIGPLVGIVIVVALLIAGALYFWGAYLNEGSDTNPPPLLIGDESGGSGGAMMEGSMEATPTSDPAAGLPPQSTSDELSSIEADLEAMNFDTLEAESEAELGALETQ